MGRLLNPKYVSPGFEAVIDVPGAETGKLFNLWFNLTLSDDPERWDGDVCRVNECQSALGELREEHRLIRAHIAQFCRNCAEFPESVALLLEEIGEERLIHAFRMGCEGRGLLELVGKCDASIEGERSGALLDATMRAVERWRDEVAPDTIRAAKVYWFLGEKTEAKTGIVDRLLTAWHTGADAQPGIVELAQSLHASGENNLPAGCFGCPSIQSSEHFCKCLMPMLVDSILIYTGQMERGAESIDFRRYLEECVLNHCLAINAWLAGEMEVAMPPGLRVIPADLARVAILRVRELLGDRNPAKIWLAACLLKTVAKNQRWRKGSELIDALPEATSWLKHTL